MYSSESNPPLATKARPHQGALDGTPPERTMRRSIGASSGSTVERTKRAMPLNGLMRRVRTAQSSPQTTASTSAAPKNAGRRIHRRASSPAMSALTS